MSPTDAPAWWLQIPAADCYWTVLPADQVASTQANAYRFEACIPIAIEEVQVSSLRLDDGSMLLCALEKTILQQRRDSDPEADAQRWIIAPASVPDFVDQDLSAQQLQSLNFLHGSFLSIPQRRWQRTVMITAALCVCACICIVLAATWKQYAATQRYVDVRTQATYEILRQEFPGIDDEHLFSSLEQSRRRLANATATVGDAATSTAALAMRLMQQWPSEAELRIESVNFQSARIFIRGSTPSIDHAQQLWKAFKSIDHGIYQWQAQPLQAQQDAQRGTVFQIALRRGEKREQQQHKQQQTAGAR